MKVESEKSPEGLFTARVTLPKELEGPVTPVLVGECVIAVKAERPTRVMIPVKDAGVSTVAVIVEAEKAKSAGHSRRRLNSLKKSVLPSMQKGKLILK